MMINRDSGMFLKSSFNSVEKDLAYITQKIGENESLLKLLVLKENDTNRLSAEEKKEILKNNIKIVPKLTDCNTDVESYIVINFDNFTQNEENPEYRDKMLIFDIICHLDTWNMGDFKLRPYKILGHLDMMFNKKSLDGTCTIDFMGANVLSIDDSISGVTALYSVIYPIKGDTID